MAKSKKSWVPKAERFRSFVEQVRDYAMFMIDAEGHVVTWNEGAERIKGYKEEEILGQHISRFYMREDVERRLPEQLLKAAKSEGRVENEGWRVRKDGSRFWADVVITAIRDERGTLKGFGKVTRDLTDRKEAEQALSDLSGRLVEAQDEERRRISAALNDSTSPGFVSLVSKLYQVRKQIQDFPLDLVDESIAVAESLFREIRTVSYLLHPPSLETEGLLPTLRSYLDTFAKQKRIPIEVNLPEFLERLPHPVEVALYQVVHESLTGILRSVGGSEAMVGLTVEGNFRRLEVSVVGRGLSPAGLEEIRRGAGELGVAFAGMRERIRLLDGSLTIDSTDSRTTVTATVPLAWRPRKKEQGPGRR